jgi:hypothetical protein
MHGVMHSTIPNGGSDPEEHRKDSTPEISILISCPYISIDMAGFEEIRLLEKRSHLGSLLHCA